VDFSRKLLIVDGCAAIRKGTTELGQLVSLLQNKPGGEEEDGKEKPCEMFMFAAKTTKSDGTPS
jgi:hypothetical protein